MARFKDSTTACAIALFAATLLVSGCAESSADEPGEDAAEPDPEDPCKPGPNPSLELGHGEIAFETLEDGGSLELIHGPQGGYHTLTSLQAVDINGSEQLVGELRGYIGDQLMAESHPYLNFRCSSGEGLQVWGKFLIWEAEPEELHLQTVRIEAEVTDASGVVVTASKEAIIHDPIFE